MSRRLCSSLSNWNLACKFHLMIYKTYPKFNGLGQFSQLWRQNVVLADLVNKASKAVKRWKWHVMPRLLCCNLNNWNLACQFYLKIYKTYPKFNRVGQFRQLWRENVVWHIQSIGSSKQWSGGNGISCTGYIVSTLACKFNVEIYITYWKYNGVRQFHLLEWQKRSFSLLPNRAR